MKIAVCIYYGYGPVVIVGYIYFLHSYTGDVSYEDGRISYNMDIV